MLYPTQHLTTWCGQQLIRLLVCLLVLASQPAFANISNISLIDADADTPVSGFETIPVGSEIDLGSLSTDQLNIRANVPSSHTNTVKSVKFILRLNGQTIHTQVENVAPYALYGDVSGDFNGSIFEVGSYQVVTQSYNQPNGQGNRLDWDSYTFEMVDNGGPTLEPILGASLVDALTDQPVSGHDPIVDGATFDLAEVSDPGQISITVDADTENFDIYRIHFDLDGEIDTRVEATAPYALFGDVGVDITGGAITDGDHTLTIRAEDSAGNILQPTLTLNFSIINGDNNDDGDTGDGGDDGGDDDGNDDNGDGGDDDDGTPPPGDGTDLTFEGPIPANTQDILDTLTGSSAYVDGNDGNNANACTLSQPCKTIGKGMELINNGSASNLIIRGGDEASPIVYRERIDLTKDNITIIGYPGEIAILTGTVAAKTGWTKSGNNWWRTYTTSMWEHPMVAFEANYGWPEDSKAPEMVVADGAPLKQLIVENGNAPTLTPGTFYREGSADNPTKLFARFPDDRDPTSFDTVEIGDKQDLFTTRGNDVSGALIAGLNFVYGSSSADSSYEGNQGGIFDTHSSEHSTFRDITVMWANGVGVSAYGDNNTFVRVRAISNGLIGYHANMRNSTMVDCFAIANNWNGFEPRWEAGGLKMTHESWDNVIDRFYAADNDGPGVWFDVNPTRNTLKNSKILNNQFVGVFVERGTSLHVVENNVIYGTRLHKNPKYDSLIDGAGLALQGWTNRHVLKNNTIYSNEGNGLFYKYKDGWQGNYDNEFVDNLFLNNGAGNDTYGNVFDHQVDIECDAGAGTANLGTTVFDGNLYWDAPYGGDTLFKVNCGSGNYNSLTTWRNEIHSSINEDLVGDADNVIEDLDSRTGYTVDQNGPGAGKGATLDW